MIGSIDWGSWINAHFLIFPYRFAKLFLDVADTFWKGGVSGGIQREWVPGVIGE